MQGAISLDSVKNVGTKVTYSVLSRLSAENIYANDLQAKI